MAYQALGLGSSANDGTGDDLRTGGDKINDNFVEIYTKLGNGSTLTSDTVGLLTGTQTLTNKTLTAPTINGVVGGTTTSQTITTLTTAGITGTGGALEITADNYIVEFRGDGSTNGAVGQIQLNCSNNSHGQKIKAQPHSEGVTNEMLLPKGANSTLVSLVSADTLTNKTLTSPVLTTPQINDTSSDHQYVFAASELAADRTVTLPLLTGNDEFVFKDHAVTMTNKTMGAMFGTVQALSGAGAVDVTSLITQVTTTGADALTLANGANGQLKIITMVADGGDGTLTPTTFANGSTITFNDVGDSAILVYNTTGGWAVVGSTGVTIA